MTIPYIINTIDYRNQSHGVRAIHKLCHVLRQKGHEAYVTSKVLNTKGWNTPTLFDKKEKLRKLIIDGAIVVYPEVWNNELYSKCPVSWRLLPDTSSTIEQVFVYHQSFDVTKPVLYIEDFEHEIFNMKGVGKRKGVALYLGKGFQWQPNVNKYYELVDRFGKNAVEITRDYQNFHKSWPNSRKTLAKLLKRVEMLYVCDPSSQITAEARFCGCPVVYAGQEMPEWCKQINDPEGFAFTNTKEEVAKAAGSVWKFEEKYFKREQAQDAVVDNFIKITQDYAEKTMTRWEI